MIIFISDLHFVDGSAGEHNVPADAFRIFFCDIAAAANRLVKEGKSIENIKIVFLGDVFDLLRTEMWFDYSAECRPWGSNEAEIEKNGNLILDAIIARNRETFDLIRCDLKKEFDFHVEPERIYLPGNHDRLCNKYPAMRKKIRDCLGIEASEAPFSHSFTDPDHGVFARHGHEYDKFNYEGGLSYGPEDYLRIPIGDPITTELVSKLPYKIMQNPDVEKMDEESRKALERNLQEIEDVRPFSTVIEWLLYQVKKNLSLKEIIECSIDEVVHEFEELPYVKKWYEHHDKWFKFMDEADQIQSFLFLLDKFRIFPSEKMWPLIDKVKGWFAKDDLQAGALKERCDAGVRYVVYGHTHEPLQVPIRIDPDGSAEYVYLNTGTWRKRYYRCAEGQGFIGWKNLTYVTFYTAKERGLNFPSFETWTGTLKSM